MTFDFLCVLSTFIAVADVLLERLHKTDYSLLKMSQRDTYFYCYKLKKGLCVCVDIACYFTGRHFSPPNYHDIICEK